jgi:uncharacterized membrane protein YphA (DoxX/SURF4 family)
MENNIVYLVMRVSVGIVFLLFGIGKFQNDIWAETIKNMDFFMRLPLNVNITVYVIGTLEVATGIALISGLFTRFFAFIAALQLFGILLLLRFQEIRDIGLLGASLYMAAADNDSFGIDWFLKKRKEKTKR